MTTAQTWRDRHPFPEQARPLLAAWKDLALEIEGSHPHQLTRSSMDGLGDPVGPRRWDDNRPTGYKVFLVYFLPVTEGLINHNLSVEFGLDGSAVIRAGNHVGTHLEIQRRAYRTDAASFATDLRWAAVTVGLLPS